MTIYKGVILGILRNASPALSQNLTQTQKRRLATIQRLALLRVTKTYRTESHEAVQVLAGAMPLDLILREDVLNYGEMLPEELRVGLLQTLSGKETPIWLSELLRSEDHTHKRNSEIINSLLGIPKVLNDAGRSQQTGQTGWFSQFLFGSGRFNAKLHDLGKDADSLSQLQQLQNKWSRVFVYSPLQVNVLRSLHVRLEGNSPLEYRTAQKWQFVIGNDPQNLARNEDKGMRTFNMKELRILFSIVKL
ncbi:retrovirus-related Pol polyprotein from type-1 retrotransposable element R1 4 [Halyomorpha halys]|uniref:retrovirus-related Pol polyprotein from type-1 retrotransposable element R1 4 n=1 Tax=Halyomorpha halys TaxID=286706 RepID=UPI0034D17DE9